MGQACHSCRGSSFLPRGAFPEGRASAFPQRLHAGSLEALRVSRPEAVVLAINKRKRRVSASFHILDEVILPDENDPGIESSFTWGKKFFKSCRDGNLKRLDLDTYFALKSAISKQLYRHLDKHFYLRPDWTYDLRELAFEHVGMSRNYAPRKIKQELNHALKELEGIGFLEPMTAAERYSKTRQGTWNIRFVRKLPPPAETPPAETKPPEPEPTGLEKELVERGVTRSVAADLVRDFPEERIRRQIEVVDWLRETKPKRIKNLGAYLAEAIRKDFAPPAGFKGQAERAAAEATARARQEREERARQAKARARSRRRSRRTGRSSPPTSRSGSRPRRWTRPTPPPARRTRRRRGPPAGCSRSACATSTSDACSACPRRTDPRGRPGTPRSPATGPGAAGTKDPLSPHAGGATTGRAGAVLGPSRRGPGRPERRRSMGDGRGGDADTTRGRNDLIWSRREQMDRMGPSTSTCAPASDRPASSPNRRRL